MCRREFQEYPTIIMEEPLVTVVVPCYNHERFVQECIQSIIDQEYRNIELIIIDDGSKDDSVRKIQELLPACQSRFERCEFRARPNKGLSATLNEALELTHGKYFSPIASDDVLYPDKLTKQVAFLESEPECLAVFGGMEAINEFSVRIGIWNKCKCREIYHFDDVFLRNADTPAPSALLRTQQIKDVGGYNEKYLAEDFYMLFKLLNNGGYVANIGQIVVKYRRHDSNFTKNTDKMWEAVSQIMDDYKDHQKYKIALAVAMLFQAVRVGKYSGSKIEMMKWFYAALHSDSSLIFSVRLYRILLRIFKYSVKV